MPVLTHSYLSRYGLESTIFLKAVESQVDFVYEEDKCKLTVGRVTLQMFDRVIVQVCVRLFVCL